MLRAAVKSDIDSLYKLGSKFDEKFQNKYDLISYIDNGIYLINIELVDNNVVGFIICTILNDTIEILLIYVDEKYRGQKIGQSLLTSIEKKAQEIILEVSKENEVAIHLYKKQGYEIIATREKYYNGIDALVMKKVLK